ncbi:MAG: SH3 domain-containing protein [Phycisphaerales bacterium]|nr:SH3 domain-containing protein [Phycisphaerales bacterium]
MIRSQRLAAAFALLVSGVAFGQDRGDAQPVDPIESAGFWVRVTGDSVNLRYRPDLNATIVAKLNSGMVLRAISEEYGWYRVEPPPGVYSLAHADFIEMSEDGKTGTVRVNENSSLRIRVGSEVVELAPERCEVQARLLRGDKVEVIGRDGMWLHIRPPPHVYYALSGEHAERISDDAAKAALREQPVAGPAEKQRDADSAIMRPAGDAEVDAVTPDTAGVAPSASTISTDESAPARPTSGPINLSGPWGQKLVAVEARIQDLSLQTFDPVAWKAVLNELAPIAAQNDDPPIASLAAQWHATVIDRLRSSPAGLNGVALANDATATAATRPTVAVPAAETPQLKPATGLAGAALSVFTATGEIRLSLAAPIGPYGVRYILIDPMTRATMGFVEFKPEARVNPQAIEGQFVGVVGERRAQPGFGRELITATGLTVLPRPQTPPARYNGTSPSRR